MALTKHRLTKEEIIDSTAKNLNNYYNNNATTAATTYLNNNNNLFLNNNNNNENNNNYNNNYDDYELINNIKRKKRSTSIRLNGGDGNCDDLVANPVGSVVYDTDELNLNDFNNTTASLLTSQKTNRFKLNNTNNNNNNSNQNNNYKIINSTDEQDNEQLIRETQAALKSLSGSWPADTRGPFHYRVNEPEENVNFQNLFQSTNHIETTGVGSAAGVAIGVPTSTTAPFRQGPFRVDSATSLRQIQLRNEYNNRVLSQQFARKDNPQPIPPQYYYHNHPAVTAHLYDQHDFNELVTDDEDEDDPDDADDGNNSSSNDLQVVVRTHAIRDKTKLDNLRPPTAETNGNAPPFSLNSAFKPIIPSSDLKKCNSNEQYPSIETTQYTIGYPDLQPTLIEQINQQKESSIEAAIARVPSSTTATATATANGNVNNNPIADPATVDSNDCSLTKPMDSPDSKQYIILQPAGIGSRAASVMKDIARGDIAGVVSVSAVSSTSSPGLDQVTSTNDRLAFDRINSSFSPNKGKF